MKYKENAWPTDGATRKYVDRAVDRLTVRIDRLVEKNRDQSREIKNLQDALVVAHGAGRR